MDWIAFLHIFTILNKILLFPLFFFKKNNSLANKLLAILILLPIFPILSNYLFYTGSTQHISECLFLSQFIFSFFGPVYLFYCMEMAGQPFKYNTKKLIHLLPSISVLILWGNYILSTNAKQQEFVNSILLNDETTWEMAIASAGPSFIVLIYIIITARLIYRRRIAFKEVFTNLETLKVNYIKEFSQVIIIEITILAIAYIFYPIMHIDLIWVPILGNLMYLYIVYKSYNYGVIFSEKDYEKYQKLYIPLNQYIADSKLKKYAGSTLSSEKMDEYADLLTTGFTEQQWHLDPELNLNTLAEKTDIPTYYISQTINQQFEKNFFDYVNSYRIETLKIKLKDPSFDHIKLEELAYICGFNSKAAFQRAFKKHTNMTPTEYRNLNLVPLPAEAE